MWHLVKVKLKHKVLLLQSAKHAREVASQAVHPAEGRHADFTWLVAAEGEEPGQPPGNVTSSYKECYSNKYVYIFTHVNIF